MIKLFASFLLWILGWKIKSRLPSDIKKCVIIAAPHTSNFDFIIGRLSYFTSDLKNFFLIKKEVFNFFTSYLLKAAGGIPVDRNKSNDLVNRVVKMFEENESFYITITPEGTRKLTTEWKKGFYHIAIEANVPIALAYIDYKKKEGGYGPFITPSGDYEKDLKIIQDFYRTIHPRYPEKSSLTPIPIKLVETIKTVAELKNQYCCKR